MNVTAVLIAVGIVGGVGLLISIFLSVFGNIFAVPTNPQLDAVIEALPGNNCGGCGYPGCSGLAEAIVKGEAPVNGCPVGGNPVASVIAEIMGVEAEEVAKKVAYVKCGGTCEHAKSDYNYTGIEDCKMLSFVPNGGPKSCDYGCLGFGSCKKVCKEEAIDILDGIAHVNMEKCKGCGQCVSACPKHIIELVPYASDVRVACSSQDKGKAVMQVCTVGCIGCGMCSKVCEAGAIKVENNIARIDYDLCTGCGACAEKCPRKIIDVFR